MTKDIVKEAFSSAEKELREKQVDEVKKIVKKTLERIKELDDKIDKLQESRKILRLDIEDLKEGKIDRIVERQEKDPKAKDTSVVIIIKEKEVIRESNPWYWPYRVIWNPAPVLAPNHPWEIPQVYCGCTATTTCNTALAVTSTNSTGWAYINCSAAKDGVVGTYEVGDGVVHLR